MRFSRRLLVYRQGVISRNTCTYNEHSARIVWQAVHTRYHCTVIFTDGTSPQIHEPNLHCVPFSEDKRASNQYQHNDVGFCPFQTQTTYWRSFVKHTEGPKAAFLCSLYLHTYWQLTYLLTPRSRVFLEKLIGSQLVKKLPAFYGTRSFITAFTSARHLSLSRARSIQSIPPHPTSWKSILILSYHLRLGLSSGLFPSGFPTKTLYTPPPPCVLYAPPILFFSIW